MSQQDTGLYKSFAAVLGALVVFTLLIIVIANIFSPPTDHASDPLVASNIKKQIEPVGRSNVRAQEGGEADESTAVAEATPVAEAPAAEAPAADASGDENTEATIEETGSTSDEAATDTDAVVDNSAADDTATTGDAAADAESDTDSNADKAVAEKEAGNVAPASVDTSVEIPLNVRAVVATNCAGCHANGVLGAQRNDDAVAWQGLADKGIEALTASVINGLGDMPARGESSLDDAELELAVQHMINKNLGGQQGAAASGSAASTTAESGATAGSGATAESSVATEESTDAAAQSGAEEADSSVSEATASVEIPDNVKAAVDTLCAACHISGVGNAPKYGDKDDWAVRMANGIDAVAASAIAGKGAMPARGGSQLTDEEIKLAIQYMVSK